MFSLSLSTEKDKGPYILYLGLENKIGSHVAVIGSNVNLTCESQNTRVQNYFTKNGSVVQEGDGKHYTLYYMPDHMRNVKVANLEIKNVTLEDAGNYTCFAWLDGIRKNSTFSLSVGMYFRVKFLNLVTGSPSKVESCA